MDNIWEFNISAVEVIFISTIVLSFGAAYVGRKHSQGDVAGLADRKLNKWLLGLSAGATANSGFIVTGAVGLGYMYGLQYLFLPIAWFLGDLIFWKFFPQKINQFGKQKNVSTLSGLLCADLSGKPAKYCATLVALLIILCLGGYTSAQWIAGQKFVSGAFELSPITSLTLFALLIVAYSSIGGFRGSVYADAVQAVIRLTGTLLAMIFIGWIALSDVESFKANIQNAGPNFHQILPGNTLLATLLFILGYAFASLGFGLGQPQLVSRYLAGRDPEETQNAKWIYIGFVQFTWISMTLFGAMLRGVMPEIDDPETGLSLFFSTYAGSIITGIIIADIFSTIAATSNSLLVAMAQAVIHDFGKSKTKSPQGLMTLTVIVLGLGTMIGALVLSEESSVFEIALGSVSLMGAGLAAPVIIKLLGISHSAISILVSIASGLLMAILWKYIALSQLINEAAAGILAGLLVNWLVTKTFKQKEISCTDRI